MIARFALATVATVVLVAAVMVGLMGADAHTGHIQKILFTDRWYQTQLDLTTSYNDPLALFCENDNYAACAARWNPPIGASLGDWNAQPDTAEFLADGFFDENEDVIIRVWDETPFGPDVLGIALTWDAAGNFCPLGTCGGTYRWGEAWIGDDAHSGVFGTDAARQATISHELGHLLSLCHESVQGDCHTSEGNLFECGTDDSGPIPFSIMSYDCIDPPGPPYFGSGIYLVQPFDVCGVNHAYPDGAFGFAGCPATPTPSPPPTPPPTPSPTPVAAGPGAWGNVDCGGGISSVDALKVLRFGAGLSVSQTEPCTNIGDPHPVVLTHDQGDIDCNNTVNSVDALKILRFTAGLSVAQTQPCPIIGTDL